MSRTIVVVGAGLAGLRASEQLRAHGWTDSIMVIGNEVHPPYNRPPLTKTALRDGVDPTLLAFRQRASTADVAWRLGCRVTSVDLAGRTLTLADGSALAYDGLVLATGVRSRRLAIDARLELRHTIRTIEDAQALHEKLTLGARVVIVGGGFIGCEVAGTASGLGCSVTVVEPFTTPLEGPAGVLVGAEVQRRHESHGVTFRLGRTVTAVENGTTGTTVVLDDGSRLEADVVVEAVGSVANTEWLSGQGLDLTNGVLCDADLHPLTSEGPLGNVVAIGDVARFPIPMFGTTPYRIEHWTMPTDTAAHAARSLLRTLTGEPHDGPGFMPLPTFWSDQYGMRIQSFGMPALGRDDVRVLEGDLDGEAAIGFHRDGLLVGIVLFGMAKQMLHYRTQIVEGSTSAQIQEIAQ
jgi:3-phenylpropionate/trans-cinnamate dioxygenase ferredoxin reductase subunit